MEHATRTIFVDGVPVGLTMRRYSLELLDASGVARRETFDRREVTIGTSVDCDFRLHDSTVSRRHCRIMADPVGYRVVDLGSKNGTRLGPFRVKEAYLEDGAFLTLGNSRIRWVLGSDEVEIPMASSSRLGALRGKSLTMREIFGIIQRVAPTDATVLVEGESGTGKELVAREIHRLSRRAAGPFVVFDCSAVPANLIESELFGHVKGAFTGASGTRQGAFELAHGGTLFLDEIGELGPELQPKLLRAIETRVVRPVGGAREIRTDVRLVAATNRNLAAEVEAGRFREDLYYRLAVIKLRMPPLRERPEDVPLLVKHFIKELGGDPERLKISYETMEKLKAHPWPGNVRELRNFIERTMLLAPDGGLSSDYLDMGGGVRPQAGGGAAPVVDIELPFKAAKAKLVEGFEREYWSRLLDATGGNVSEAARRAGVHRKSAEYLIKKLGLR